MPSFVFSPAGWLQPLRLLVAHGWLREAGVDAWLGALRADWRLNRTFARVHSLRWVAADMLALRLKANRNWPGARPGQAVLVYGERDGVRLARCYSLTAVRGRVLELAIKRQPGGRFADKLIDTLLPGDVLELGAPSGELEWPRDADSGVLLLAAGSGITALYGLLREALAKGCKQPVWLLHSVRRREQRAFVPELQALMARHPNLRVQWLITGEPAGEGELHGRLGAEHLRDLPAHSLLACGPHGFVQGALSLWNAEPRAGTAQWEAFSPPPAQVAGAGQAVRLEFARSGLRAEGDDQRSLLEQAEARGLKPKHGCRQGICTECTCQLLEGRVRDLRSGRETSEPGQPIRICVSAPLSDVRIDL